MPDKNLTVNEIVKACEVCACVHGKSCEPCPYYKNSGKANCLQMRKDALDLINRLQAEKQEITEKFNCQQTVYADLSKIIKEQADKLKTAKSEARKEFAERVKNIAVQYCREIDNLLKEMEGEGKNEQEN